MKPRTFPRYRNVCRIPAWLALSAVVLLTACGRQIGRDFDPDHADQLLVGVSTLDDAKKLLGQPFRIYIHGRSKTAKWWYLRDSPAGTEAVLLEIRFGPDGKKAGIITEFEQRKGDSSNSLRP